MRMWLSDSQIKYLYDHAEDQYEEIQILADLNAVSKNEMENYLESIGINTTGNTRQKHHRGFSTTDRGVVTEGTRIDHDRCLKLYNQGMNDPEIGRELGFTPAAISAWRYRNNLPPNIKRKRK